MELRTLSYAESGRFAPLVTDYLAGDPFLADFHLHSPDLKGLRSAAAERTFSAVHRSVLVAAIRRQYTGIDLGGPVGANIALLEQADTLTVTTGHQLCLFTGPLYVPFKLLNAVHLARTLSKDLGRAVVPVFWMATEDHDRAEIDHTWVNGERISWPGSAGGAVGRMPLSGIGSAINALEAKAQGAFGNELAGVVRDAYRPENTLAEGTRRFVHALFGKYGLVIIDGDDKALKTLFVPVMREEILNGIVKRSVDFADERLKKRYAAQAHARSINLFHLRPGHRSRIEADGDHFQVLDGGPRFTAEELLLDLEVRPQDYSPNVLLRPVYQELVLPNIAAIGGGGEVAYWMQLRWLFQAVGVPMPVVMLRTSAAFLSAKSDRLRSELGLELIDLFRPAHDLRTQVARAGAEGDQALGKEMEQMETLFRSVREKVAAVDPTLGASAESGAKRTLRMLEGLVGKMDRARRRTEHVRIDRLQRILDELFPDGGLQERRDNILPMLAERGLGILDVLLERLDPLEARFTVLIGDQLVANVQ